jgi:glycosyltransferase involved in cell wall biosynthesis
VKNLPAEFNCRVVTFHASNLTASFLTQFPCPVHYWPLKNAWNWNALRIAWRLRRLIQQERIDIVHTFFQTADLWAAPIAKLSGARVLISSRRDMGFLRGRKHSIGYRLMSRLHDQIQAVSDEVRLFAIREDGIDPRKTVTVYNGVDVNNDLPVAKPEATRQPTIVTVANLRHVKGIDVLVKAAAIVHERAPEAQLVLVGKFGTSPESLTYQEQVMSLCHHYDNDRYVHFLGESLNIPELLARSSIFVLPSRTEGHSNALLEAMLAGLPCVATTVGGNSETVVDQVTGFLVPTENPEILAARLIELLENPDLRKRMGTASRKRVLEHFTAEKTASRVAAAYRDLLARKSPTGVLVSHSLIESPIPAQNNKR